MTHTHICTNTRGVRTARTGQLGAHLRAETGSGELCSNVQGHRPVSTFDLGRGGGRGMRSSVMAVTMTVIAGIITGTI